MSSKKSKASQEEAAAADKFYNYNPISQHLYELFLVYIVTFIMKTCFACIPRGYLFTLNLVKVMQWHELSQVQTNFRTNRTDLHLLLLLKG